MASRDSLDVVPVVHLHRGFKYGKVCELGLVVLVGHHQAPSRQGGFVIEEAVTFSLASEGDLRP